MRACLLGSIVMFSLTTISVFTYQEIMCVYIGLDIYGALAIGKHKHRRDRKRGETGARNVERHFFCRRR
jgi:hypothetical protein